MLSLETSRAVRGNAGGLPLLCAEIWVAEEGLAEKGTERRIDLISKDALQFGVIFQWIAKDFVSLELKFCFFFF